MCAVHYSSWVRPPKARRDVSSAKPVTTILGLRSLSYRGRRKSRNRAGDIAYRGPLGPWGTPAEMSTSVATPSTNILADRFSSHLLNQRTSSGANPASVRTARSHPWCTRLKAPARSSWRSEALPLAFQAVRTDTVYHQLDCQALLKLYVTELDPRSSIVDTVPFWVTWYWCQSSVTSVLTLTAASVDCCGRLPNCSSGRMPARRPGPLRPGSDSGEPLFSPRAFPDSSAALWAANRR